jgi:hypothetical protein
MLVGLGTLRLVSHRHLRYGGMRMDAWQLTLWSFLMASAHGAGLMVMPFVLRIVPPSSTHAGLGAHAAHMAMVVPGLSPGTVAGLAATLLHTAGYIAITAGLSLIVYHKLGLYRLRKVWVNLDLLWGIALIATGVSTALI